ncbi:MAG: hypothetical protein DWG77_01695 [Chloroflexi bacterium]|nr:hypothetical protein [Chloroflexota bacterium]
MSHSRFSRARPLILVAVAALAAVLIACSDAEDETMADSQSSGQVVAVLASCSEVAQAMAGAFPEFTLIEDEGRYSLGGEEGSGCRTLVAGSAAELPSFVEIAQALGALMTDARWVEDSSRMADRPTGTIAVYGRGTELAVVAAGASPKDPTACGADEVISACFERLEPAEIEIQGSVTVVNAAESGE